MGSSSRIPNYDAVYWYNKGALYGNQDDTENAMKFYDRALEIDPNYSKAWYNKGVLYHKKGDAVNAMKCYECAIEIKPNYAEAWYNKGGLYHKQGDTENAMKCYECAIEIKPNYAKAWYNKGGLYHKQGDAVNAMKCYDRALVINPNDAKAWFNKGLLYHKQGDAVNARKCVDRVIAIDPNYDVGISRISNNEESVWKEFSEIVSKRSNERQTSLKKPSAASMDYDNFESYVNSEDSWKIIQKKKIVTTVPEYGSMDSLPLDPRIKNGFKKRISQPYKYQIEAISAILNNESVVISAPTAAGKTYSFLIPVIQKIINSTQPNHVFALFVYPTKALSSDQVKNINGFLDDCGLYPEIRAEKIDGSVKNEQFLQKMYINKPQILVTNFDTIHYNLPYNKIKAKLFVEPEILVVDETHSYCSFFGTNVHYLIKRLENQMSTKPQIIAASATLDNAKQFCEELFDRKMRLIEGSGLSKTIHRYVLYPKSVQPNTLMANMAFALIRNKKKTLVFSNDVRSSELISRYLKSDKIRVKVHNGNLSDEARGLREKEINDGDLDCLSCTPTLELGMDIGTIDGVVSKFTYNLENFEQRIGRAGRVGQDAFAIMILDNHDVFSTYFRDHIDEYFDQDRTCHIYKDNPIAKENHEWFMQHDMKGFTEDVFKRIGGYSIRDIGKTVKVLESVTGYVIGNRSMPMAVYDLHKGAIFLHDGKTFRSNGIFKFDSPESHASVTAEQTNRETRPQIETSHSILNNLQQKTFGGLTVRYCELRISQQLIGYTEFVQGEDTRNKPLTSLSSSDQLHWSNRVLGVEITFSESLNYETRHTIAHLLSNSSCIILRCDPHEIEVYVPEDGNAVYFYDNSAMGANGFSRLVYENIESIFGQALRLVSTCQCHIGDEPLLEDTSLVKPNEDDDVWGGCVNCTFITSYCKDNNKHLDKLAAKEILNKILL